jgi:hypothetical protein
MPTPTWLVSSNSFDIIGAKSADPRTACFKRDPNAVLKMCPNRIPLVIIEWHWVALIEMSEVLLSKMFCRSCVA